MQLAKHWLTILLVLFIPLLAHASSSQPHSVQSPPHTVALLELYTSEG